MIREDDPVKDRSIVYSYSEGNITKKEEYAYTTADTLGTCIGETNYTYGNNDWKDLLTSYNGQTITYDEIGNPISYMGNTLAWDKGRQLQSNTASNGETIEYKYDVNGLRTQKKVGNTTHEYTYVNGQLYAYEVNGQRMFFTYDDNGSPLSCIYNGVAYHYQTNLQGDVIGIVNNSGTKVVTYSYDAWGYPTGSIPTSGVGYMNPLRYRGYVYDFETGFYYVSSRYYDPGVGRFLNLDEFVTTGQGVLSYNMYAYCLNNPVNRVDYTGNSSTALKWWSSTMWWLCGADSILPFGDTLYVGGMLVLGAVALGTASNTAVMIPKVTPKIKIKTKEIEKVKVVTKSKSQTRLIYRYGKTNPGNLTPKKKDKYTGLSFSTVPPPAGTPAVVTTIGRLNSTGKVIAIQDGLTHVSVIPAPHMGTLQNWIDTGSSHPCTEAVKSVVIKWNGVY